MDRREAFTELVRRHQDLAVACALARLGSLSLAEEAAQEAFVTAWEHWGELRDLDAFPAWLRAIVHSQCCRMTRGGHLVLVPLEAAGAVAAGAPDAETAIADREAGQAMLSLIRACPEGERTVTALHYLGGYRQTEIAALLELSTTAVGKRLFSARRRMKARALDALERGLHASRPSRDEAFERRVVGRLRPSEDKDRVPVGALALLHHGGEDWLRDRPAPRARRQYVVEHATSGEILGYGAVEQSVYRPRWKMMLVADPGWLRQGVGDRVLERLLADLGEAGAVTVAVEEHAARDDLRAFLAARGFVETRRVWDLRLDLDEIAAKSPGDAPPPPGVTLTTLAAERARDPHCLEKLHELGGLVSDDPVRPPPFDEREARLWLDRPCVPGDGFFIALEDGRYVGLASVNGCDAAPGQLRHGTTGVLPERRRRGIATALKRAAIQFARRNGYQEIRTSNRPSEPAILALNEKLGYKRRYSSVTLERCLREVARLDPSRYDAYAGSYRTPPGPTVLVTVEDGRLFAAFLGQKVELFPESERSFFIKWFHGAVEFDADASRLVWRHREPRGKEVVVCAARFD